LTVLILSIISFIISYSFDGYRSLGLHPFFYNFALLALLLFTFGNSLDKLHHTRSVAYSVVELVLLNKQQISGGGDRYFVTVIKM